MPIQYFTVFIYIVFIYYIYSFIFYCIVFIYTTFSALFFPVLESRPCICCPSTLLPSFAGIAKNQSSFSFLFGAASHYVAQAAPKLCYQSRQFHEVVTLLEPQSPKQPGLPACTTYLDSISNPVTLFISRISFSLFISCCRELCHKQTLSPSAERAW